MKVTEASNSLNGIGVISLEVVWSLISRAMCFAAAILTALNVIVRYQETMSNFFSTQSFKLNSMSSPRDISTYDFDVCFYVLS